jgi:hypothetical protein
MTFLERHLEDPVRWSRIRRCFLALLLVLAAGEAVLPLLFAMNHAHFWFEDIPAWGSLYGLVSCVVIIVASKLLGKLWLTRPETYYDS